MHTSVSQVASPGCLFSLTSTDWFQNSSVVQKLCPFSLLCSVPSLERLIYNRSPDSNPSQIWHIWSYDTNFNYNQTFFPFSTFHPQDVAVLCISIPPTHPLLLPSQGSHLLHFTVFQRSIFLSILSFCSNSGDVYAFSRSFSSPFFFCNLYFWILHLLLNFILMPVSVPYF